MKKIIFSLALSLGLVACDKPTPPQGDQLYPWQIQLDHDGATRVFGIRIGQSTLADAEANLQTPAQLALYESRLGALSLEAYVDKIRRGGLEGRLVFTLRADAGQLQKIRGQAANREAAGENGWKYTPSDSLALHQMVVTSLTYLPVVDLEPAVITGRFGQPTEVIRVSDKEEHYLYPEKGLDIMLHSDSREVMQFVAPSDFKQVTEGLRLLPSAK